MRLFQLDDEYNVVPEKNTLMLIPEFYALWNRRYNHQDGDRDGKRRNRCKMEIVYLYFFCDYRSEFFDLTNSERREAAMDAAGMRDDYKFSDQLITAQDKYFSMQETRELKLLKSAYGVIDKLNLYFTQIEITDSNSKATIDNMSKVGAALAGLKKLEDQMMKEQRQDGHIRGGQEKGFLS